MRPFTFFISYRRDNNAPIALLLKNELEKRMQFVRVFVDVEEMEPGDVFPERLRQQLDESHATIALIGHEWMPRRDEVDPGAARHIDWVAEELRLSQEADFTMPVGERHGLERRVIIPLFVNVARDFGCFELPADLQWLSGLQAEAINHAGWPGSIGPLIDRMAVKLKIKKRPDAEEYPIADPGKARTQPLSDTELTQILAFDDFDGWYIDNYGNSEARYLVKTFRFPHFNQAADFMKMVSDHCRVQDHHPEWRNVFNFVTVSLTTWDAKRRVTIYDMSLALFMNMAAKAVCEKQAV